jgi:hypothetical protein
MDVMIDQTKELNPLSLSLSEKIRNVNHSLDGIWRERERMLLAY